MTATRPEDEPDPHPDSPPTGPDSDPQRVMPDPDRKTDPVELPGAPDGDEIMRRRSGIGSVTRLWSTGATAGMKRP